MNRLQNCAYFAAVLALGLVAMAGLSALLAIGLNAITP